MKKIVTIYSFNPTAKTVTLGNYLTVDQKGLLLITNVTDNIIIYNFADPTQGGTVAGNKITLQYDTSSMSSGDNLQIFYDDGESESFGGLSAQLEHLTDEVIKLRTVIKLNSGITLD